MAAAAWLMLLRPYGFQLEDEGTLLAWFDRAARGQRPYLDFHTGYTPGLFAMGSAVFQLLGTSATALRGVLAGMNVVSAALFTVLAARLAGRRLAVVPALAWLAFVPVYVGEFAGFNIPYPTWPVTLAWALLPLVLLAWARNRRPALLLVAGSVAAFALWMRPNSGAFALAASTWVVVAFASRRTLLDRLAAPLATAFMLAGVWWTFEFRVLDRDAFVHLVPGFAIALLLAGPVARRLRRDDAPSAWPSLLALAAGFLAPTLAWAVPLAHELGPARFLREVFLVGADYQVLYYKPHPAPEPYAVVVVLALLGLAAAGRGVARGLARPMTLLAMPLVAAAAVLPLLARAPVAPEGLLHSLVAQVENASFWLTALAAYGAASWLAHFAWAAPQGGGAADPRGGRQDLFDESPHSRAALAMVVAAPMAVAMGMQLFPRSDFMHQAGSLPLAAVVATGLLARVLDWWGQGDWPRAWNGRALAGRAAGAAITLVLGAAFVDKAPGLLESLRNPAPAGAVSPRLDVVVEQAAGEELESIAAVSRFLEARTGVGEPLFAFPAASGLLFAAGRTNAAPHDYWYPGRPDHAEEESVLQRLHAVRPRYVVTLNRGWDFLAGSPGYFTALHDFLAVEYRLALRQGRYDVLARRDLVEAGFPRIVSSTRSGGAAELVARLADGAPADVIEPNLERRRQAAWRWMDSMGIAEAASAHLPSARRGQLLLLRAIRDGGDVRAAGWIVLGLESSDERVRAEAIDAAAAVATAFTAAWARPANDVEPAALRPFVAPWAARAAAARDAGAAEPFRQLVAALADGSALPLGRGAAKADARSRPDAHP